MDLHKKSSANSVDFNFWKLKFWYFCFVRKIFTKFLPLPDKIEYKTKILKNPKIKTHCTRIAPKPPPETIQQKIVHNKLTNKEKTN